jgi:DNA-binding XRE family transcriptional regulator
MGPTKFSELRDTVVAKPGAAERLADLRAETLEEIRLYELRHREAIGQAELAGRRDVTQGAISKLEDSDDVRVSTLCQYLTAPGARLELVAVRRRGPSGADPPRPRRRRLTDDCQHRVSTTRTHQRRRTY